MSTSVLVAKERQPGSPFGLGQKQAKNLWRKRATVAPYFEKIRCKRATVARYSMLYRVLCNALQRASQKQKNTVQMRHSCTLFDILSIFV